MNMLLIFVSLASIVMSDDYIGVKFVSFMGEGGDTVNLWEVSDQVFCDQYIDIAENYERTEVACATRILADSRCDPNWMHFEGAAMGGRHACRCYSLLESGSYTWTGENLDPNSCNYGSGTAGFELWRIEQDELYEYATGANEDLCSGQESDFNSGGDLLAFGDYSYSSGVPGYRKCGDLQPADCASDCSGIPECKMFSNNGNCCFLYEVDTCTRSNNGGREQYSTYKKYLCGGVTCTAESQCHDVGTCDPSSGVCTNPPKVADSECDDQDETTVGDVCDGAGLCAGTVMCPIFNFVDGVVAGDTNPCANGIVLAAGQSCDVKCDVNYEGGTQTLECNANGQLSTVTCTQNVDCAGTWSECTAACETADMRTFTPTRTQSGNGAACPAATDCQYGEGTCVCAGYASRHDADCRTYCNDTPENAIGSFCNKKCTSDCSGVSCYSIGSLWSHKRCNWRCSLNCRDGCADNCASTCQCPAQCTTKNSADWSHKRCVRRCHQTAVDDGTCDRAINFYTNTDTHKCVEKCTAECACNQQMN